PTIRRSRRLERCSSSSAPGRSARTSPKIKKIPPRPALGGRPRRARDGGAGAKWAAISKVFSKERGEARAARPSFVGPARGGSSKNRHFAGRFHFFWHGLRVWSASARGEALRAPKILGGKLWQRRKRPGVAAAPRRR